MPHRPSVSFFGVFLAGAVAPFALLFFYVPASWEGYGGVLALAATTVLAGRLLATRHNGSLATLCETAASDAVRQKGMETGTQLQGIRARMAEHAQALTVISNRHQDRATKTTTDAAQAVESATSIASAIEEMNASITEIDRQADEAAAISRDAAERAKEADKTATDLSDQSDQILSIVEMIREIAERTNLLALNATIEAARAGDAGKGFAVVASEVKTLAKQTAEATTKIESQINAVRIASHAMKTEMGSIEEIVTRINAITGAIKTSLHEETGATHEIARSAGQTKTAAMGVTEGTSHMLVTTEEIRRLAALLREDAQTETTHATL